MCPNMPEAPRIIFFIHSLGFNNFRIGQWNNKSAPSFDEIPFFFHHFIKIIIRKK